MNTQADTLPQTLLDQSDQSGLKVIARNAYGQQKKAGIDEETVAQYLPLVHKIVRRAVTYLRPPLSQEDLVSAGMIGLLKAARDYDSAHEAEFQTYAYIRIRGAVLDELKKHSFLPTGVSKQIKQTELARAELTEQYGCTPSDEQLADKLDVSVNKLYHIFSSSRARHFLSIDHSFEDESYSDCLTVDDTPGPSNRMEKAELVDKLTEAITQLDQRQRRIIVLYYQQDLTMKQIAEVLELTEPRVSQLHAKAIFSLSVKLNEWRYDR